MNICIITGNSKSKIKSTVKSDFPPIRFTNINILGSIKCLLRTLPRSYK